MPFSSDEIQPLTAVVGVNFYGCGRRNLPVKLRSGSAACPVDCRHKRAGNQVRRSIDAASDDLHTLVVWHSRLRSCRRAECYGAEQVTWRLPIVKWSRFPLQTNCRFTPWTMKSDYGRWAFCMVGVDGPTSMAQFFRKSIYKLFGHLIRCNPNVH